MKKIYITEKILNEILDDSLNISDKTTTNKIGTDETTSSGTMEFGEVEPISTDEIGDQMVANTFYNRRNVSVR